MAKAPNRLETESYKGVRDFYPEEMFLQNYIFGKMRDAAESFGYVEYSASILEPAELYKAKSGEEIVNEQTYIFRDRGEREVALRPEMTPTVARLVAKKKRSLTFPLRWYSIPNVFRYERPQKGRLREHWQLNADIFGVPDIWADIEIVSLARRIMKSFGAKEKDFVIKINHRKLMEAVISDALKIGDKSAKRTAKLLDKKEKISQKEFDEEAKILSGERFGLFSALLKSKNLSEFLSLLPEGIAKGKSAKEMTELMGSLGRAGAGNIVFDQSLMRGFDYYTGVIFEVFSSDPEDRRSLFGGGRYDELMDIFGAEKVPAVGFGMGDVTIADFLEKNSLKPEYRSSTDLYIGALGEEYLTLSSSIASSLRESGLNVLVNSAGKPQDHIKKAEKLSIPYIAFIGETEAERKEFMVKELESGREHLCFEDALSQVKTVIRR